MDPAALRELLVDAKAEIEAAWESEGIAFSAKEDARGPDEPTLIQRIDEALRSLS